jgi:hypothetical protein
MILNNRIIWDDGGTLKDLSAKLNNIHESGQIVNFESGDALYIGSDLPFNHRYFEVVSVNSNASIISVSLWDGTQWNSAVDLLDQTSTAGVALSKSGHVSWVKPKNKQWVRQDTDSGSGITGLSSLVIYNLYWAKITFSANVSGTTSVRFIGQKFSDDNDLKTLWPDLVRADAYAQWPSQPKTNWDDQHFEASEYVIRALKRKGQLISSSQILNWEIFREASAHKCAELIMNSMGKDWAEPRDKAAKYFNEAIELWLFDIDKDSDTILDDHEKTVSSVVIRR